MRVDRRVSRDLQLWTRWGDVLVDVQHVRRHAKHDLVTWTDSGATLRLGAAPHELLENVPAQLVVGPLAVEVCWVAPADPLEPGVVDHRFAWITANALLIFFSAAAAMVVTPRDEEEEGLTIQLSERQRRHVVTIQPTRDFTRPLPPVPRPTKRTETTHATPAKRSPRRGEAAHRALEALFQGSGTSSLFSAHGLNDSLDTAISALRGSSEPPAGALALGPRGGSDLPGLPGGPGGHDLGTLTRRASDVPGFSLGRQGHRVETPPAGPVRVEGGLDRDVIRRVVQRHQSELRYCYEHQLQQHPDLAGKIAVTWTIDASGGVASAEVAESSIPSDAVADCALARIRRWRFPEPQGGGVVVVTFPWVFHEAGSD